MAITTRSLSEEMSKLKAELVLEFCTVKDEIIDLKKVIIQNLHNEGNCLNNVVSEMSLNIVDLESKCNSLEQYGRRNNLQISGIPDSVDQTDLEDKVVEIFDKIGIDLSNDEIEACHRIGKSKDSSKTTIILLVNRKKCKSALFNRKKLRNIDTSSINLPNAQIYINENLSPANQALTFYGRKLKRAGLIFNCYTFDGVVQIKRTQLEKPKKILHFSILKEMFPEFKFIEDEVFQMLLTQLHHNM